MAGWAAPPLLAQAANLDTIADRAFGQPDFGSNTANKGGVTANSLLSSRGVAVDGQGHLYVADTSNNRVLE